MRTTSAIRSFLRGGGVMPLLLGAVACTGVVLVSIGGSLSWRNSAARSFKTSRLMFEITPMQLEVALRRTGLTPESLAAAGLAEQAVGTVVAAGRAYLVDHEADLDAADEAFGTARNTRDRLQRLVESGLATENDVTALTAAQTALSTATTNRDAILSGLYDAAIAGLGGEQKAVIAQIKAGSAWDLPTQYLATTRSQTQWVDLRDDLANLRISAQLEEEPDPGCVQDVNTANADPAVAAASTNLSNQLAVVSQAWTAAIGG
jgi:hypothetical protein